MKLPLLLSVPHAGLRVPPEAEPYCVLTPQEIAEDGDEGAAEIYDIEPLAAAYLTTDIARAIIDLNRAEDDRRPDGVVKTQTCWEVPVYHPFPPDDVINALLAKYYHPYHARLKELAGQQGIVCGVDCHTMLAKGPPIGPGAGIERPWVCLSNSDGACPQEWIESLRDAFQARLEGPVTINDPFKGGYIVRSHRDELPWIQLELSRGPFLTNAEKRRCVEEALQDWSRRLGWT